MKNYVIYSQDQELLDSLEDEYVNYLGRDVKREADRLTVFARRRQKPKKKDEDKKKGEESRSKDRTQRPKERR